VQCMNISSKTVKYMERSDVNTFLSLFSMSLFHFIYRYVSLHQCKITQKNILIEEILLRFNTQNKIALLHRNTIAYNRHHPSMATCFVLLSFLDHLQANIFQQKVQSVRTTHYGIPYCLQGVRKNNYKAF
jgi:hypothetical protein